MQAGDDMVRRLPPLALLPFDLLPLPSPPPSPPPCPRFDAMATDEELQLLRAAPRDMGACLQVCVGVATCAM